MGLLRAMMIASFAWFSSACAGATHEGIGDFEHARYPEALECFRRIEPLARNWDRLEKARYALYRGLTHLALGDHSATVRWLGEATRASNTDPSVFSQDERNRLAAALAHLPH
jgi:hypothetical protein